MDYKSAGVDVEAGYQAVELMKKHVSKTHRPEVMGGLGGFGGLFSLASRTMNKPILVSGTDGVGTKLKLAFLMDKHDTIGIDCVAMCVNDIICSGAEPLFFLDYIACGKNKPEKIATIVEGIANGCVASGAALIGGETAEMPGFYADEDYDLAGFAVGIVDEEAMIDGSALTNGDVLIGLPSSGVHSNGFSLVRQLVEPTRERLEQYEATLGKTLGEALIEPTRIYVKALQRLSKSITIKSACHITGGGFYENIPRMLKDDLVATIRKGSWPQVPIFDYLKELGQLDEDMMYHTFNMGIGMIIAVGPEVSQEAIRILQEAGEEAYVIGQLESGKKGIRLC